MIDSREGEVMQSSVNMDMISANRNESSFLRSSAASTDVTDNSPSTQRFSRALSLMSIKVSTPHSMVLDQLLSSDRSHQEEGMRQKKRLRRLRKEVYQMLSIYALLQGVLFAAVAQTTIFTCADWWGPAIVAGAVTMGALHGVADKLGRIGQCKREARRFQSCQNAVNDQIQTLYFFGSACSVDSLAEPGLDSAAAAAATAEMGGPQFCFLSLNAVLVLFFLLGFSSLIIASCIRMLCSSCMCQTTTRGP